MVVHGVGSFLGAGVAFFATAHLARALPVAEFGTFSLARAYTEYALILCTMGLTVVGARELAKAPRNARAMVVRIAGMRTLVALGLLVAFAWVALATGSAVLKLALVLQVGVVLAAATPDWAFSGLQDMRVPAAARLTGRVLYLIWVYQFVRAPGGSTTAALGLTLEATVLFAATWIALVRLPIWHYPGGGRPPLTRLAVSSIRVAIGQVGRQFKTNIDLVILGALGASVGVGYYAAAYRLLLVFNMLSGIYATVLMPRLSGVSANALPEVIERHLRWAACAGLVFSAATWIAARDLTTIVYGSRYAAAGPLAAVLLIASGPLLLSAVLGSILVAQDRTAYWSTAVIVAAGLNAAANLILIPHLGALGAAWATLVTEIGLAASLVVGVWSEGVRRARPSVWPRAVLGVAVGTAFGWLVARITGSGITAAFAVALVSAALLVGMRVLPIREVRSLVGGVR